MSIPRNLGNFADNVNVNGKVEVTGINATGTPLSTTALFGNGTWQSVSVTPAGVSDQNNTSTGYFDLPTGTTAQRPASPTNGMVRFNTTLDYVEWYSATTGAWFPMYQSNGLSVDYIIVGGGGAGSNGTAGGGGGGGFLTGISVILTNSNIYPVVIGAGGAANPNTQSTGASGVSSSFNSFTALGGGYGANTGTNSSNGGNGGNGGGAANYGNNYPQGSGTIGQGFAGAASPDANGGGGGGGSGGAFVSATRNGGNGAQSSISGTATYYSGGGGGAGGSGDAGTGGLGGGTNGVNDSTAASAASNTGGGAGGGWSYASGRGGSGGSGIVIIKYSGTTQKATGGIITQSGGNTIHTFITSGNFIVA
jgi:hypothetical protein